MKNKQCLKKCGEWIPASVHPPNSYSDLDPSPMQNHLSIETHSPWKLTNIWTTHLSLMGYCINPLQKNVFSTDAVVGFGYNLINVMW